MQIPVWEGRAQTRGKEEVKGEREHGRIDGKKTKAVRRQTNARIPPDCWLFYVLSLLLSLVFLFVLSNHTWWITPIN